MVQQLGLVLIYVIPWWCVTVFVPEKHWIFNFRDTQSSKCNYHLPGLFDVFLWFPVELKEWSSDVVEIVNDHSKYSLVYRMRKGTWFTQIVQKLALNNRKIGFKSSELSTTTWWWRVLITWNDRVPESLQNCSRPYISKKFYQNGVSVRLVRILLEVVRETLHQRNISRFFRKMIWLLLYINELQ